MTKTIVLAAAAIAALAATSAYAAGAPGGDAAKGAVIFKQQCSLCHSVDPGVENAAPNLRGVIGRKAAGDAKFGSYTPAIKGSKAVWTATSLDTFLGGPAKMIPGTAMPITLPDPKMRRDVIAYLASLHK